MITSICLVNFKNFADEPQKLAVQWLWSGMVKLSGRRPIADEIEIGERRTAWEPRYSKEKFARRDQAIYEMGEWHGEG